MSSLVTDRARFRLPVRIRSKRAPDIGYSARFKLTDRISVLPFVQTVEESTDSLPATVHVVLQPDAAAVGKRPSPRRWCSIGRDGITIRGLCDADRYRVISRGWGRLNGNDVQLHLPKDDDELEVCWSIVYRAYSSMIDPPAGSLVEPRPQKRELPEHSRTILC